VLSEAAARLRGLKTITAAEAATWQALSGRAVIWRGAAELPTQPIAELAGATIALIDGRSPPLDGPPPPGHAAHWLTWRRRHQALAR
jgi:hypothetical protein